LCRVRDKTKSKAIREATLVAMQVSVDDDSCVMKVGGVVVIDGLVGKSAA
jgi:hypothetical protein